MALLLELNCNQEPVHVVEHNGCSTKEVCNVICVHERQDVVNRQMVDVVTGVHQLTFTK